MLRVFDAATRFARVRCTRTWRLLALLMLAGALGAGPVAPVRAAEPAMPEAVVTGFDNALLHAMQNSKQLGYHGRYQALAAVMNEAFDFEGMTRIAVGPKWLGLTPAQRTALVEAFRRFSIASYADQFDGYSGERFAIIGRTQPAQGIVVATSMSPANGEPVKFSYLLHQVNGAWRIIDIYLDGTISQLAVRRSEFASVLAKSGPDELVRLLDEKTNKLAS